MKKILLALLSNIIILSMIFTPIANETAEAESATTVEDMIWDGGYYSGEILNNVPHGLGQWINDKTGISYEGQFQEGKFHGKGTYTWSNGDKYVGEWKNGDRNGEGTKTWSDGDKYVGQWKDDKFNGKGTYYYTDGAKYVGQFKDDKFNGKGTYYYANGDKYVGNFKDDKFNGKGTYYYADGDKYVGQWKDDKKIIDNKAPKTLTVNKVTTKTTSITGKTEAKATVRVKIGSKLLGKAIANSKGNFIVKIKAQKNGKKLIVTAADQAGNTKAVSVTVKAPTKPKPKPKENSYYQPIYGGVESLNFNGVTIKAGMTKSQIINLLGRPTDMTMTTIGTESLIYRKGDIIDVEMILVVFNYQGRVAEILKLV